MEHQILPAKKEHLKEILAIYNYYIKNSTATYYTHQLSITEMEEKTFFKNKKYGTFIITDKNDTIIGYCILGQFNKKEGYDGTAEISIYLRDSHTKKGIGRMAIEFLEQQAKNKKIHVLISAVTARNHPSRKLFEKCGYTQCAHFKEVGFKFGEILDDIYFQKIID